MGVQALDEISKPLKKALGDLKDAKVNENLINMKYGSVGSTLYTIQKAVGEIDFLSENLKQRGFRDKSLYGRLKQAFIGLMGGY